MSATNRGSVRQLSDFYETPIETVSIFLNARPLTGSETILEPAAGTGNIVKTVQNYYPRTTIDGVDVVFENCEHLLHAGVCRDVYEDDFLTFEPVSDYDLVITNPPYSLAKEFILHSFEIAGPSTEIIMLLRLSFLESQRRYQFWQSYPTDSIYVLSRRPSFTGGGTDATAYAWFIWNSQRKEKAINVI